MELRHLRYFLAVAEAGHFGQAASRLHIVQPALSMQIRALEEELGSKLFRRTSRKVELTQAGALLRVEAERTLAQAERARSVVQRAARGQAGSVRIAFAGNAAFAGKLSADLRAFHDHHPSVELEAREIAGPLQPEAVLRHAVDVAYGPGPDAAVPGLIADRVGAWPWLVAMAHDHRLAANASVSAAALAGETFILYAAHARDDAQLAVLRQVVGREPRIAHRVSNTLTVLAMAAAGLGLALVPALVGAIAIHDIQYRPLARARAPSVLMLLSRVDETAGAVRAFIETARRAPEA